jgi:hypothetical protein
MVGMGSNSRAMISLWGSTGSPSASAEVTDQAGGLEGRRGVVGAEGRWQLTNWGEVIGSAQLVPPYRLSRRDEVHWSLDQLIAFPNGAPNSPPSNIAIAAR